MFVSNDRNADLSHDEIKKRVAWEKGTRTADAWEKGCEGSLRKRGKNSYEFFIEFFIRVYSEDYFLAVSGSTTNLVFV